MKYNTKQREKLIDFFDKNKDKSLSAKEIALVIKDISPSAIYRNLIELERDGSIRRVAKSGSRKAYYQYISPNSCKGHLHLSCTKCGKTTHLDDKKAHFFVENVLKDEDFNIDEDTTILYGVCKKCKK